VFFHNEREGEIMAKEDRSVKISYIEKSISGYHEKD